MQKLPRRRHPLLFSDLLSLNTGRDEIRAARLVDVRTLSGQYASRLPRPAAPQSSKLGISVTRSLRTANPRRTPMGRSTRVERPPARAGRCTPPGDLVLRGSRASSTSTVSPSPERPALRASGEQDGQQADPDVASSFPDDPVSRLRVVMRARLVDGGPKRRRPFGVNGHVDDLRIGELSPLFRARARLDKPVVPGRVILWRSRAVGVRPWPRRYASTKPRRPGSEAFELDRNCSPAPAGLLMPAHSAERSASGSDNVVR